MATIKTWLRSSDPKVTAFIQFLGIELDGVSKVVIVIEAGKRVQVRVTHVSIRAPKGNIIRKDATV